MKTSELKILIEAAEQLGHTDIQVFIDDSRDGNTSYTNATAELVRTGDQHDPQVILAIRYGE